jgi:dienelactone hydrolase
LRIQFDAPTLILHGDDDQIVPIGASALLSSKLIANARLKVYKDAPHGMCSTRKDEVNAAGADTSCERTVGSAGLGERQDGTVGFSFDGWSRSFILQEEPGNHGYPGVTSARSGPKMKR